MKKLLLLGALISSVAMAEGNVAEARIGANFGSTTFHYGYYIDDLSNKVKSGFELAGEYRTDLGSGFQVGGGIAYRYNKLPKFEGYESKGLHSFPIYATARYNFNTGSDLVTYVKANLGYSFNTVKKSSDIEGVKAKNGLYTAVGVGVEYMNVTADLAYVFTGAKIKISDEGTSESFRANNSAIRLTVGYKFSI